VLPRGTRDASSPGSQHLRIDVDNVPYARLICIQPEDKSLLKLHCNSSLSSYISLRCHVGMPPGPKDENNRTYCRRQDELIPKLQYNLFQSAMQRQRLLMVQQCFQDQRHRPIIDALDSRQPTAENETEHKILLNHYTQRRVTPASPNNIATRLPPGAINYLDRPNARYHVPDSIPPSLWPALGSNSANVHLGSKITIVQRSDDLQEHSAPSIASATHQSTREPANPFAVLLPSLITSNEDRSGTAVDPNGHLMRSSAALLNPDNLIKQFSWLSVDPTGSHLAVNTVNASADSPKCGNPAHLPDASLSTSRTLQEDSLTFHGIHPAGTSSDDMTTQLLYGAIDYFGVSIPCCSVRKLKSALPLSASGTKPATDVHLRKSETLSLQGPKARDGTQDSLASATSQSADTPANLVKAPKSGPNTFKECSDSHQAANASHSRECSNSARRSTARLPGPQDGMMMSTHQDEELLMFTDRPSFERSNDPQCNAGTSQDSSSASQPLHPAHPTATLQPTTDRIHHNQVNPPSGISGTISDNVAAQLPPQAISYLGYRMGSVLFTSWNRYGL